jgi:hypothetical protein
MIHVLNEHIATLNHSESNLSRSKIKNINQETVNNGSKKLETENIESLNDRAIILLKSSNSKSKSMLSGVSCDHNGICHDAIGLNISDDDCDDNGEEEIDDEDDNESDESDDTSEEEEEKVYIKSIDITDPSLLLTTITGKVTESMTSRF